MVGGNMYIVYSADKDLLGLWQSNWTVVAVKLPIPVAAPGRQIAWTYIESVAVYGTDWQIIAEL